MGLKQIRQREKRTTCGSLGVQIKEGSKPRTEFMERISVKFSLMASTVDWMDGSKNFATSLLQTSKPELTRRVTSRLPH